MLCQSMALGTVAQDHARCCHHGLVNLSTVVVRSEDRQGRGLKPCCCHLLLACGTKCKYVGSHVTRCKQDGMIEWSQVLVLPASGQASGLRPLGCRPDSSAHLPSMILRSTTLDLWRWLRAPSLTMKWIQIRNCDRGFLQNAACTVSLR